MKLYFLSIITSNVHQTWDVSKTLIFRLVNIRLQMILFCNPIGQPGVAPNMTSQKPQFSVRIQRAKVSCYDLPHLASHSFLNSDYCFSQKYQILNIWSLKEETARKKCLSLSDMTTLQAIFSAHQLSDILVYPSGQPPHNHVMGSVLLTVLPW